MAHFYGSVQGSRGEATRCGTKRSGMSSHVRGWNVGVDARMDKASYPTREDGEDLAIATFTGGSNGSYTDGPWMQCTESGRLSLSYTNSRGKRVLRVLRKSWPKVR